MYFSLFQQGRARAGTAVYYAHSPGTSSDYLGLCPGTSSDYLGLCPGRPGCSYTPVYIYSQCGAPAFLATHTLPCVLIWLVNSHILHQKKEWCQTYLMFLHLNMWPSLKKPVLLPMLADSIFHPGHTATWINYLIPHLKLARLEWSGFAGCLSQAQWRFVRVVWGLNGALVSLGMTVCGCTALWCWISTSAVNFLSF